MTDLPVVDIHISVYDVLRTMKLAENYSSLYAIVGFPSITEPAPPCAVCWTSTSTSSP